MKIALIIEKFDPDAGGAERSTAQIAAELLTRGHQVTILTGRCPRPDVVPGAQVVVKEGWDLGGALSLVLLARWVRQQLDGGGFDASLSVTMAAPATVLQPRGGTVRETLARNVAMRRDTVERWLKHALLGLTPKYQVQLWLERRTLADPRVRRIVAVSRYVVDQLQTHYRVDPAKIELIPNAAVVPTVGPEQRQAWRRRVREAFGIGDEQVAYLFAAVNPRLKGFEPLIEAMALLAKRDVPAVVLLAGGFVYEHQAKVAAMGLRDRVRFIGQTRQMAPLYAAADVTVLPTFYDPASKVVIESLMMSVPAISSGYNGASDWIEPENGPARGIVVADPADASGLAEAMAALADPERRRQCAQATVGLDRQLTMKLHVDRLEQVLADAAGLDRPQAAEKARLQPTAEIL